MTQPSGRAILLDTVMFDTWTLDEDGNFVPIKWEKSVLLDDALRQLFDAMLEIVGENENEGIFNLENGVFAKQHARNQLRAKLRERLRVFFEQPEANGKDGGRET